MSAPQSAEKKEGGSVGDSNNKAGDREGSNKSSSAAPSKKTANSPEVEERPETMQLLSKLLMEEQEKRAELREEHGLNSTWKDLQSAYETAPSLDLMGGENMYDTFNDVNSGPGNLANRLAFAASRSQTFMGSPDQSMLKAERKTKKDRKKKRKDARKEAKKQARMMITTRSAQRFG